MTSSTRAFTLSLAASDDLDAIRRIRHDIYASELRQHNENSAGRLGDALDDDNVYIIGRAGSDLAGFVSITPPDAPAFSIDKYFKREMLPVPIDNTTFEVRILSISAQHRGSELAAMLIYAAFRWVEAQRGRRIVVIGRRELMPLYERIGLRRSGITTSSGAVQYEFMHGMIDELGDRVRSFRHIITRMAKRAIWALPIPMAAQTGCFHGGAFFEAIGERFDTLERRDEIINADVLDAWFDPAPGVIKYLDAHLPWLVKTSPPTACSGLIDVIAQTRGVAPTSVQVGAGSSDLIFRFFLSMLGRESRALLLDPTYGEYSHVFERVIGCTVDRFPLNRRNAYTPDLEALGRRCREGYNVIVLVNPNSPTGRYIDRERLVALLRTIPRSTLVWIDETYLEYVGSDASLERFAAGTANVLVCKSMSKVYGLSGLRVAYLCGATAHIERLRSLTPPWVVGLPAQLAAIYALQDPAYYAMRYAETHATRAFLAESLRRLGCEVVPGAANFLLFHLPEHGASAAELTAEARSANLFLRDAGALSTVLGDRALRVAVKDRATTERLLGILERSLNKLRSGTRTVLG